MARTEDTRALLPRMQEASKWLREVEGRKVGEACKKFKVPYGTFWMVHERNLLLDKGFKIHTDAEIEAMGQARMGNLIEKYRAQGDSWGTIMAKFGDSEFGWPEGKIRKAWSERTNKHHEGTRVGHGGRFLGGEEWAEVLYRGTNPDGEDAKKAGTKADRDLKWEQTVERIRAEREATRAQARKATAGTTAKKRAPRKVAKAS